MNQVIITDCFDCSAYSPLDSDGCGMTCSELQNHGPEIPCVGEDHPIPDWCPKLQK